MFYVSHSMFCPKSMFLVFTLVLLTVAVGILVSVYSVFFPFMQNLWTVNNYYTAYYGAVSAVERAELGLRYKLPWFVWSWWFLWTGSYGPASDYTPDVLSGDKQWFWWTIDSRTQTIPSSGMGNTDAMLSYFTGDSKNYNQIWYVHLESFLLSYDDSSDIDFYSTGASSLVSFSGASITGIFRLPPKIHTVFGDSLGKLCDNPNGDNCDPDGDGIYDDAVLSWSMEWNYKGKWFKLFPTTAVFYYSGMQIDYPNDTVFRESVVNDTWNISFAAFSPISNGYNLNKHNVVGQDADFISWQPFQTIFSWTDFTGLRLSFGAANLFRTRIGSIYPYLEYQFTFSQPIADRFYTIVWHGRVGEYDVQIVIKKPTVQWTVGGDFTVIF